MLDADIDRLMGKRTRSRPVASGRVPGAYALEFGLALSALSFVLLAGFVNVLTAALALLGNLFYVFVYTRWLKRSTPQNIVIGGAAGAIPPLVGWAAATGNLTLPALVLFGVVFLWTPPHFWALALLIRRDYEAAGVPMLPVVRGERETARQIVLYTAALVAFTLAPALWGMFGLFYVAAAAALGARSSSGSPGGCATSARHGGHASSSTTRSPTSRCSSWRWRWIRFCDGTGPGAVRRPGRPRAAGSRPGGCHANNLLGLALFGVFLVLFGGTFLVGLLYLAFD